MERLQRYRPLDDALSPGDLTVFVSDEGDAIAFDGWLVGSLGGFEQEKIIHVNDDKTNASTTKAALARLGLGSWVKSTTSEGSVS